MISGIIGEWTGISRAPRASENSRFELNLEADATEPHARADGDLPKVTRINSPDERRGPGRLQPSLSPLYSHRARRSDDDQSPSARHKARQQFKKKKNHFKCLIHGRTFSEERKSEVWFLACVRVCVRAFPVPFPSPSSPCAHLSTDRVAGGPQRRAAVSSALINIRATPTLRRAANGGGGSRDSRALIG